MSLIIKFNALSNGDCLFIVKVTLTGGLLWYLRRKFTVGQMMSPLTRCRTFAVCLLTLALAPILTLRESKYRVFSINEGTNTVSAQECEKNIVLGLKDTLLYLNKKCGYSINGVLDVGANDGNWSLDLRGFIRAEFETDPSFYLIEGSDAHAESLRNAGIPYHIGLVADVEKVVTFIKRGGSTGNTMFPEKRDEEGVPGEFLVKQKALSVDQIVKNAKAGPFNFMKLDVQGAETLALTGSKETLKTVDVIATEASIQNYNIGGTDFYALHSVMNELGYAVMDIIDMNRHGQKDAFLIQIDILWVKKSSRLWSKECTGYERRSF